MIFSVFKQFGFWGILGPPYYGICATIRIGQQMLCLLYVGFFLLMFSKLIFCHEILFTNVTVPTKSEELPMWKKHLRRCLVKFVEKLSIKKSKHYGTLTKKTNLFWFPVEDINISDIFYQIQNLYE